jgi:ubiquinone/menaquinone biosynthesis C-methylase UbiE
VENDKWAAQRWFDRRAGSYEGGFTARWRDPLQRGSLEALKLTPADLLLDVGCGTGWASRTAAGAGTAVVGIDLSEGMIRQATTLSKGIDRVRFALADAESLPFADGAFTALLCTNAFHHYPRPQRAVAEMTRVLAPGGRLVIGDASADLMTARIADVFLRHFEPGHVRLYRLAELGALMHGAGLLHVAAKRVSGGGQAIVRGVAA